MATPAPSQSEKFKQAVRDLYVVRTRPAGMSDRGGA